MELRIKAEFLTGFDVLHVDKGMQKYKTNGKNAHLCGYQIETTCVIVFCVWN